jgi:hypothetical protein
LSRANHPSHALSDQMTIDVEVVGPTVADMFREAQGFLTNAAAVSRILWPPRVHDPNGNTVAKSRGLHLRTVLGIDDNHPLRTRTLRDHFEHFDERLDRWSQETTHGGIVDLHIGPTAVIGGPAIGKTDFLRVYEPDRKIFIFRGDEFDIQQLVTGLEQLKAAVIARMETLRQATVQQRVAPEGDAS